MKQIALPSNIVIRYSYQKMFVNYSCKLPVEKGFDLIFSGVMCSLFLPLTKWIKIEGILANQIIEFWLNKYLYKIYKGRKNYPNLRLLVNKK